jgi:hypothetical protein
LEKIILELFWGKGSNFFAKKFLIFFWDVFARKEKKKYPIFFQGKKFSISKK